MMTSAPTEQRPAAQASASMSEDMRLSMPMTNTGRRRLLPEMTAAAALPRRMARSMVSFSLAMPRTPSVPNNLPMRSPSYFPSFFVSSHLGTMRSAPL